MNNSTNYSDLKSQTSGVGKASETKNPSVNILWTGGLDSTFRMIQLSSLNINIQPFYLSEKRNSEKNELQAISEITKDILNHPDTKCILNPVKIVKVTGIKPDKSFTKAYYRLTETNPLGIQYEWLGRFSETVPGLELCIEQNPSNKAYNCIRATGKLLKVSAGQLSYYIIDKENSNPDLYKIFGNYHIPDELFATSKLQMVENYKKLGYENTLEKTWFCHNPVKDEPCGICSPCISVIEEGLSFRLPSHALKRYHKYKKFDKYKWYRILSRWKIKLLNSF